MTTTASPVDTVEIGNQTKVHYDRTTIFFHWATVLLVLILFGTAFVFNNVPREWHWRRFLEGTHVSFGILFALVIIGRVLWRAIAGRRLPPAERGAPGLAAAVVHSMLYMMIVLQIVFGYVLRWYQAEDFSFFGLFAIPDPLSKNRDMAELFEHMHNFFGWAIVYVAVGHAIAALVHYYWLKDRVLGRMIPAADR